MCLFNMSKPKIFSLSKLSGKKLSHLTLEAERSQETFLLIKRLVEIDLNCPDHLYDFLFYQIDNQGNVSNKLINVTSNGLNLEWLEIKDHERGLFIDIYIKDEKIRLRLITPNKNFIVKVNKWLLNFEFVK